MSDIRDHLRGPVKAKHQEYHGAIQLRVVAGRAVPGLIDANGGEHEQETEGCLDDERDDANDDGGRMASGDARDCLQHDCMLCCE